MKAIRLAGISGGLARVLSSLTLAVSLTACGPVEPPPPLPGDPVKACRAGIQDACAYLGLQQQMTRQLSRPIPVQPVQGHRSQESRTTCQRHGDTTYCNTTSSR